MRIAPGTPVGPYVVISRLGSGESGEVYRAEDMRLGRQVALKVLSPALAEDRERVRRFEQESHAVAGLNHPGILAIYDVGAWRGTRYLVTELLEGQTLRERLQARGSLPPRRAVEIARELAEALAVAHGNGVVHRDLKPENVFITQNGRVKILDFGLARQVKRMSAIMAGGTAETVVQSATSDAGLLLGSVGYMAPEQVQGGAVDGRADLFSLGAILYEMISGRRAFQGDSAVETLHAILKEEPAPLTSPQGALPGGLAALVAYCLEKDPGDRFQNAHDLSMALATVTASAMPQREVARGEVESTGGGSVRRWMLGLAGLVAIILILGAWLALKRPAPATSAFEPVTFRQGTVLTARFAPDRQSILYGATWEGQPARVYMARTDSPESRSLGITGSVASVSSTGRVALLVNCRRMFFSDCLGTLAEMPLAGGAPRELVERVLFADWSPDGKQLAIVRWTGEGTQLEYPTGKVIESSGGWISNPRISPSGDAIAWLIHPVLGSDSGSVMLYDLKRGQAKMLSGGWNSTEGLAWGPNGKEVWFAASTGGVADTLYAVNRAGKLRTVQHFLGMVKLEDVAAGEHGSRVLLDRTSFRGDIAGRFPGDRQEKSLSWLDASVVTDITADGRTILFFEGGQGGGPLASTYLRRTDGSPAVRLGDGTSRTLSPDGRWALAQRPTNPASLLLLPTGAGEARVLAPDLDSLHGNTGWFPDSQHIFYIQKQQFYRLDVKGGKPELLTPRVERGGLVTPDGRSLLALGTDRRWYLYPVPGPGGAVRQPERAVPGLTTNDYPLTWSSDGQYVFVRTGESWPIQVDRVRIKDGAREPWRRIEPQDRSGIAEMSSLVITPDGRWYAYGFHRVLSNLYQVDGLR